MVVNHAKNAFNILYLMSTNSSIYDYYFEDYSCIYDYIRSLQLLSTYLLYLGFDYIMQHLNDNYYCTTTYMNTVCFYILQK